MPSNANSRGELGKIQEENCCLSLIRPWSYEAIGLGMNASHGSVVQKMGSQVLCGCPHCILQPTFAHSEGEAWQGSPWHCFSRGARGRRWGAESKGPHNIWGPDPRDCANLLNMVSAHLKIGLPARSWLQDLSLQGITLPPLPPTGFNEQSFICFERLLRISPNVMKEIPPQQAQINCTRSFH